MDFGASSNRVAIRIKFNRACLGGSLIGKHEKGSRITPTPLRLYRVSTHGFQVADHAVDALTGLLVGGSFHHVTQTINVIVRAAVHRITASGVPAHAVSAGVSAPTAGIGYAAVAPTVAIASVSKGHAALIAGLFVIPDAVKKDRLPKANGSLSIVLYLAVFRFWL